MYSVVVVVERGKETKTLTVTNSRNGYKKQLLHNQYSVQVGVKQLKQQTKMWSIAFQKN